MKSVILWFFNLVSDFIVTSLNWKVLGNLSFTHIILGGILIFVLLEFFGFTRSFDGLDGVHGVSSGIRGFKNYENKKEKDNYIHYISSNRIKNGDGSYSNVITKYRINKKTGEVKQL